MKTTGGAVGFGDGGEELLVRVWRWVGKVIRLTAKIGLVLGRPFREVRGGGPARDRRAHGRSRLSHPAVGSARTTLSPHATLGGATPFFPCRRTSQPWPSVGGTPRTDARQTDCHSKDEFPPLGKHIRLKWAGPNPCIHHQGAGGWLVGSRPPFPPRRTNGAARRSPPAKRAATPSVPPLSP